MQGTMKLAILIPTYNRKTYLMENLAMLAGFIRQIRKLDRICIIISDNCSTDGTEMAVRTFIEENSEIKVEYYLNEQNIGIGANIFKVFGLARSEYAMFVGDDDFISCEYLHHVMQAIEDGSIHCIIPSYYNVTLDGESTGRGRDLKKKNKLFKRGFWNCFINSWRGHQLSGLVLFTGDLYEKSVQTMSENIYIQIYFVACRCLSGKTYHLTEYPVKVLRPLQSKKDWGYGKSGLVDEVFKNYEHIQGISCFGRSLLEIKFLQAQYWRIAMYLKRGINSFWVCIRTIQKSSSITVLTSALLPLIIAVVFMQKALSLLLTGQFIKTLRTPVDI